MTHEQVDAFQCAGCGGRNQPGATLCEFCARSLQRVKAERLAEPQRPLLTAWIVPTLIALAVLSVLIFRLVATQMVR